MQSLLGQSMSNSYRKQRRPSSETDIAVRTFLCGALLQSLNCLWSVSPQYLCLSSHLFNQFSLNSDTACKLLIITLTSGLEASSTTHAKSIFRKMLIDNAVIWRGTWLPLKSTARKPQREVMPQLRARSCWSPDSSDMNTDDVAKLRNECWEHFPSAVVM